MDLQEQLDRIADMLDQDPGTLAADTPLEDIGWDSMGMLGAIAIAKSNGKTITGDQVRAFTTVGDILKAAF